MNSYLWEFNYRGELDFLRIAKEQSVKNKLVIEAGWLYFIHGWTQVISKVFNITYIENYFDKFLDVANFKR
jgi:hypothetical protein